MKVSVWVRQLSELSNVKTEAKVDEEYFTEVLKVMKWKLKITPPFSFCHTRGVDLGWAIHIRMYKRRQSNPSFDRSAATNSLLPIYFT